MTPSSIRFAQIGVAIILLIATVSCTNLVSKYKGTKAKGKGMISSGGKSVESGQKSIKEGRKLLRGLPCSFVLTALAITITFLLFIFFIFLVLTSPEATGGLLWSFGPHIV